MDILFFAAIAIFIFFKLRDQLGKISDEEKNNIAQKIKANQEKLAEVQKQINAAASAQTDVSNEEQTKANEKILNGLDENLKQTLLQIFSRCNISAEFFINGVKSCFEMIIKAFAEKNHDNLKFLLDDKIYRGFESAIKQRELDGKTLHSNIVSIAKTEILSAAIQENQAFITLKITSKQINYFTNAGGETIDGRKDEIIELNDIWTFKKDLTSPNPNWVVTATG